jgi:phosphoribosylanthranilate isomerase
MFRIKICGITRIEDAVVAAEAGADALGLNFYAKSPRCVSIETAKLIAQSLNGSASKPVAGVPLVVGVFVNASAAEIARTVAAVPLDAIQLHGDEPPEFLMELPPGVPVIRAARIGTAGLSGTATYRDACLAAGRPLAAVLLDASVKVAPGEEVVYGGSGHRLDWPRVAAERGMLASTPLVLAGGLTPVNIAEAISVSRCDGVDTASGVESWPGVKDHEMVRAFVKAARGALR